MLQRWMVHQAKAVIRTTDNKINLKRMFSSTTNTNKSTNSRTTSLRLYRILLRQLQQFPPEILLQPFPLPREAIKYKTVDHKASDSTTRILRTFRRCYNDNDDMKQWYQHVVSSDDDENDDLTISATWATVQDIRSAIQYAFRHCPSNNIGMQSIAIKASQAISIQAHLWECTSVSVDEEYGIRIIATSSYSGSELSGRINPETKYRFVYRIQVENLMNTHDDDDRSSPIVQLLGRTWRIQDHDVNGKSVGDPIVVDAPTGGAVGYQPVLHPGHVFAYMSGCHLTTKQGTMGGLLHMAVVDATTPDAKVGDQVAALKPEFKGVHLVLPVAKFVLKVPE